jgi:hypothetical protein
MRLIALFSSGGKMTKNSHFPHKQTTYPEHERLTTYWHFGAEYVVCIRINSLFGQQPRAVLVCNCGCPAPEAIACLF